MLSFKVTLNHVSKDLLTDSTAIKINYIECGTYMQ